jgi:hypothetical protein
VLPGGTNVALRDTTEKGNKTTMETTMKMAKASKEEWERVMRFSNELEANIENLNMSDKQLGAWVRTNAPCMRRVVFGYQVLVDNCADPNQDVLDFKPEIKAAFAAMESKPNETTTPPCSPAPA